MSIEFKTYEVQLIKVADLKYNDDNPRTITTDKFQNLIKSIQEDPQMFTLRPIVADSKYVVQGGNMRLRAINELGWDVVPAIIADDYNPDAFHRFVVKDNTTFGDWDFTMLTGNWDTQLLLDYGVEGFNPDWADYEPTLDPETSYEDITAEEIQAKAKELANQMVKEMKNQDVMCPECGHEFPVQI